MASDTLEFFNFYERYIWRAEDFATFQDVMKKLNNSPWLAGLGASVLQGYDFSAATGFNISVNPGIAIDNTGMPVMDASASSGTAAGPASGFGRHSLVVARQLEIDQNFIKEPLNPTNIVALNSTITGQISVINGTPSASPAYPSKLPGDIILFGLLIGSADTQITANSIDYSVADYPSKNGNMLKLAGWDAIVGKTKFTTHRDINTLNADPKIDSIKRVKIIADDTLTTTQVINHPNKIYSADPGVTYENGGAGLGIEVAASGIDIENLKMKDFTTALQFDSNATQCSTLKMRYNNCTTNLLDNSTDGVVSALTKLET